MNQLLHLHWSWLLIFSLFDDIPIVESETTHDDGEGPSIVAKPKLSKIPQHILSKIKRNSVVVITEEGDVETMATPSIADRKKSIDATAV